MRQTLLYIPHEIESLGLPVFGAGLVLLVWCLISGIYFAAMVRRQGWNTETLGFVPLMLIVAAVIYFVLPQIEEGPPGAKLGVPIRGYGVMLLIAVVTGVGLAVYRTRQVGLETEIIYSLAFWMFIAGIGGARLFFVIQYYDQFLVAAPDGSLDLAGTIKSMFNVTRGGLVVYGSLIGGLVAYALFVVRRKLPPLELADMIVPSMVLGLAIGRIGCLLNGCCFGGICYTDLPAITFPQADPPYQVEHSPPYARQLQLGQLHGFTLAKNAEQQPFVAQVRPGSQAEAQGLPVGAVVRSINQQPTSTIINPSNQQQTSGFELAQMAMYGSDGKVELATDQGAYVIDIGSLPARSEPVQPTQIYSAINGFALCLFLWCYYPFRKHSGEVFALGLTIYPVTRILLEYVRVDEAGRFGTSLTISQWISIAALVGAACLWAWVLSQKKRVPGETTAVA
jgi:phosphatidylglycerol---prolipoprotein diacylglyceryl transferase